MKLNRNQMMKSNDEIKSLTRKKYQGTKFKKKNKQKLKEYG